MSVEKYFKYSDNFSWEENHDGGRSRFGAALERYKLPSLVSMAGSNTPSSYHSAATNNASVLSRPMNQQQSLHSHHADDKSHCSYGSVHGFNDRYYDYYYGCARRTYYRVQRYEGILFRPIQNPPMRPERFGQRYIFRTRRYDGQILRPIYRNVQVRRLIRRHHLFRRLGVVGRKSFGCRPPWFTSFCWMSTLSVISILLFIVASLTLLLTVPGKSEFRFSSCKHYEHFTGTTHKGDTTPGPLPSRKLV
jgi:hypothetical protein